MPFRLPVWIIFLPSPVVLLDQLHVLPLVRLLLVCGRRKRVFRAIFKGLVLVEHGDEVPEPELGEQVDDQDDDGDRKKDKETDGEDSGINLSRGPEVKFLLDLVEACVGRGEFDVIKALLGVPALDVHGSVGLGDVVPVAGAHARNHD